MTLNSILDENEERPKKSNDAQTRLIVTFERRMSTVTDADGFKRIRHRIFADPRFVPNRKSKKKKDFSPAQPC